MYKDKDRQRQAVREATRRYRAKLKGITPNAVIPLNDVIPSDTHKEPEPQSYNSMMVGYVRVRVR